MSSQEITIEDAPIRFKFRITEKNKIQIDTYFGLDIPRAIATIDRNQAHLLKLFLEEYLK